MEMFSATPQLDNNLCNVEKSSNMADGRELSAVEPKDPPTCESCLMILDQAHGTFYCRVCEGGNKTEHGVAGNNTADLQDSDEELKPLVCHACHVTFDNEAEAEEHRCVCAQSHDAATNDSLRTSVGAARRQEYNQDLHHVVNSSASGLDLIVHVFVPGLSSRPVRCRVSRDGVDLMDSDAYVENNKPTALQCDKCSLLFSDADVLSKHVLNHDVDTTKGKGRRKAMKLKSTESATKQNNESASGRKVSELYVCASCRNAFLDASSINQHLQQSVECLELFRTPLNVNLLMHTRPVLPCTWCDGVFADQAALDLHEREKHATDAGDDVNDVNNDTEDDDDQLDESYVPSGKRSRPVMRHVKPPTKSRTFRCHACDKTFTTRGQLVKHQKRHKDAENSKEAEPTSYECDLCKETFSTKRKWQLHQESHFNQSGAGQELSAQDASHVNEAETGMTSSGTQDAGKSGDETDTCAAFEVHAEKLELDDGDENTEGEHACEVCGRGFQSEARLSKHTHQAHEPCDICGKVFPNKTRLKSHVQMHNETRPWACDECGKTFKRQSSRGKHIRVVHLKNVCFQCEECGKSYSQRKYLQQHKIREHHDGDVQAPFSCGECQKPFLTEKDLAEHMPVHTGEKPHVCDVCDRAFATKGRLSEHKRYHTGERLHACDVCGKRYTAATSLRDHQRSHTGEKPFQCVICDKWFSQKCTLKTHMRKHSEEKAFRCEDCGKGFHVRGDLNTHRRIHTGERPYQCEQCGQSFSQRGHHILHMRRHRGEKPFPCEVCGKFFRSKMQVKNHMVVHTGERNFQCERCDRKFPRKQGLRKHVPICRGTNHLVGAAALEPVTIEKPHECSICGKCFSRADNLKVHMRIHTGNKPHKCHVCGDSFDRKSYLVNHQQKHVVAGDVLVAGPTHGEQGGGGATDPAQQPTHVLVGDIQAKLHPGPMLQRPEASDHVLTGDIAGVSEQQAAYVMASIKPPMFTL